MSYPRERDSGKQSGNLGSLAGCHAPHLWQCGTHKLVLSPLRDGYGGEGYVSGFPPASLRNPLAMRPDCMTLLSPLSLQLPPYQHRARSIKAPHMAV